MEVGQNEYVTTDNMPPKNYENLFKKLLPQHCLVKKQQHTWYYTVFCIQNYRYQQMSNGLHFWTLMHFQNKIKSHFFLHSNHSCPFLFQQTTVFVLNIIQLQRNNSSVNILAPHHVQYTFVVVVSGMEAKQHIHWAYITYLLHITSYPIHV